MVVVQEAGVELIPARGAEVLEVPARVDVVVVPVSGVLEEAADARPEAVGDAVARETLEPTVAVTRRGPAGPVTRKSVVRCVGDV